MAQAAWARGLDPDRLSFVHAVRVIKRKMPQAAAAPPERLSRWLESMLAEIAAGKCMSNRRSLNPRGVRRKMSNFALRRRGEPLHQQRLPSPWIAN